MWKYLAILRMRGVEFILLSMLCLWSLAWDYQHFGQYQRGGRIKVFLLAAAAIAAIRFAKTWHWSIGLFYFYVAALFLHFDRMPQALALGNNTLVYNNDAYTPFLCITATLFVIPELVKHVSLRTLENTVLAAGFVHSVIGVLNLFGVYVIKLNGAPQVDLPVGLLGQPTVLGPFLCFAFAIAFHRGLQSRSYLYASLAPFFLVIILLTHSSMSIGSLAAFVLLYIAFYLGIIAALCSITIVLLMGYLASRYDSNFAWHSGRLEPWTDALTIHRGRPWFGYGLGSWEPISNGIAKVRNVHGVWDYLHSDPLEALFDFGRIGMAILIIPLAVAANKVRFICTNFDVKKLTCVAGLVIFGTNSLANFPLHLVPHGPLFAYCLFVVLKSTPPFQPKTSALRQSKLSSA